MADLMRALALVLIAVAAPATAAPLTMHVGETWLFSIRNGQPSAARKIVVPTTTPEKGQVRASVSALGGTTMTLTNATGLAYTFRAELIGADGKMTTARSCTLPSSNRQVFESWPRRAAAVRIGSFKRSDDQGRC